MRLTLIPMWGRPLSTLSVAGDVVTRDGVEYDLSAVPEGGEGIPVQPGPGEEHIFIGPITREGGVIRAALIVFMGDWPDASQPDGPWTVDAPGGPVAIPAARHPEPEEAE